MHMADALISPAVGGALWAVTIGMTAYAVKKTKNEMDESKIPLMGVMGAFVFSAQMINFSILGTGSSGHIGGGMLLAILLGPYAGFLTMASILITQALFFADGGLLALGCNIVNLGFYTCFIAYPFIYKRLTHKKHSAKRILVATMIATVIGLQLGSLSVILETLVSGITELSFGAFVLTMQPIHLAIGLVEGVVTAAIISFVWNARPEIMIHAEQGQSLKGISLKKVIIILVIGAVLIGGTLSWFASAYPDGLEWSMEKTAGTAELEDIEGIHATLSDLQKTTAFMPEYGFKQNEHTVSGNYEENREDVWPVVDGGTSVAGLAGAVITLLLVVLSGVGIHIFKKRKHPPIVQISSIE